MKRVAQIILYAAALAAVSPAVALADAAASFRANCAVCHGADGQGKGPFAEFLVKGAPNLTMLSAGNGGVFPKERVAATISGELVGHGAREMPVWGEGLNNVSADEMIAFLESIQAK